MRVAVFGVDVGGCHFVTGGSFDAGVGEFVRQAHFPCGCVYLSNGAPTRVLAAGLLGVDRFVNTK